MWRISILLMQCLLAIIAMTAAPAAAQFVPDYPRPAIIDPAWFAGVKPIAIDGPLQPSGLKFNDDDPCAGPTLCVANLGWMFDYSSSFVQAKPVPLNKGALRKLEASAKKFPHQQQWRLYIAQAYLQAGRFDLFFPEINAQLETWYSSTHALMMRAETLAMLGRDDLAMADVKSAEHWAWQRKYIRQGNVYYHNDDTTDVLALKAEILARAGQKREASFALVDANASVDRNERWPSHLARVQNANRVVTRLLHGWTPEQLSKIDFELDKRRIMDCTKMPAEIEQARTALYRLFDVMRMASDAHESCKRWAEAEVDAGWMAEMGPRSVTPLKLEQKVGYWLEGSNRTAIAMDAQGKHKEAQKIWSTMLVVGLSEGWMKSVDAALGASIATGRAKGIEPEPAVLASLGNAKAQIADLDRIAENHRLAEEALRPMRVATVDNDPTGLLGLDSVLSSCMNMVSSMSQFHPDYGGYLASQGNCENARREGMRVAKDNGDSARYAEYQQMRFPWQ